MRTSIIIISFLLFSTSAFSQKDGRIRERIKAQRVAYITDKLDLSPAEAQKFWPIYNQFTDEFEQIKKNMNRLRKSTGNNLMDMSDSEIEKVLEEELENQQKLTDLQRKYQKQLKSAISPRKIALLYKTERDFKIELLRKMRERGRGDISEDEF